MSAPPGERDVALILATVSPYIANVDGKHVDLVWHGTAAVRPGRHTMGVRVDWSNRYRQFVELPVDLGPGTRCLVKARSGRASGEHHRVV